MSSDDDDTLTFDHVDPVSPSLECPICRCALTDPVMPRHCQHLFCRECLDRALDLSPTCPIDRQPVPDRARDVVRGPKVVSDLVGELRVRCRGCTSEMESETWWTRHRGECRPNEPRPEHEHEGIGIPVRPTTGRRTSRDGLEPFDEEQATLISRSRERTPCRYCSLDLAPSDHAAHLRTTCPSVPTPCPHAPYGCPHVAPRATLVSDHVEPECPYEPVKHGFEKLSSKVNEVEAENGELRRIVVALEARLRRVEADGAHVKDSLGSFLTDDGSVRTSLALGDASGPPRPPSKTVATHLSTLESQSSTLSRSVSVLASSHASSVDATRQMVEEVESLRSSVKGVRVQMADVLETIRMLVGSNKQPCATGFDQVADGASRGALWTGRGRIGGAPERPGWTSAATATEVDGAEHRGPPGSVRPSFASRSSDDSYGSRHDVLSSSSTSDPDYYLVPDVRRRTTARDAGTVVLDPFASGSDGDDDEGWSRPDAYDRGPFARPIPITSSRSLPSDPAHLVPKDHPQTFPPMTPACPSASASVRAASATAPAPTPARPDVLSSERYAGPREAFGHRLGRVGGGSAPPTWAGGRIVRGIGGGIKL
ncbi:hypothetical protein JCM10212_006269 [Sporobolomyces blumeae]